MIKQKNILISKVSPLFLLVLFFILIIVHSSNLHAQTANKPRLPNSLYLRAPDTIPGTLPQMRDPSYWIAKMKDPDKVVLTLTEIEARNKAYFLRMNNFSKLDSNLSTQISQALMSRPGVLASIPDLNSKTPTEISAMTADMIGKEIKMLTKRHYGNILGNEYSAQEVKALEDEMAFKKIGNPIKVRSGITVEDCRLRIIPALRYEYVGYSNLAGWDMWNFDIVPIGSKVQILHVSKTGGFLFVLTEKGLGWINSEKIAFCSNDEIDKFRNTKDFVICTGDRIPYYSDSNCTYVSGWFRMGDRLPFRNNNSRLIEVPTRRIDGNLLIQDAWLTPDSDVSKGYLPYTRKNVVIESFKLLDNIYDWTGGWYGRDHATQLRDIFSVFGFKLPSMGGLLSAYSASSIFIYPKEGPEAQYKAILSKEPFITFLICSSGHSQLLLGDSNNVPIVFDTHGYRYNDKDGSELLIRRANVGTITFPDYFLKQTMTFVELK